MPDFLLSHEILKATDEYFAKHFGCAVCRGVRFKFCSACGQSANSYHDHRDYLRPPQTYRTLTEWREVNGESVPSVPERKLQP